MPETLFPPPPRIFPTTLSLRSEEPVCSLRNVGTSHPPFLSTELTFTGRRQHRRGWRKECLHLQQRGRVYRALWIRCVQAYGGIPLCGRWRKPGCAVRQRGARLGHQHRAFQYRILHRRQNLELLYLRSQVSCCDSIPRVSELTRLAATSSTRNRPPSLLPVAISSPLCLKIPMVSTAGPVWRRPLLQDLYAPAQLANHQGTLLTLILSRRHCTGRSRGERRSLLSHCATCLRQRRCRWPTRLELSWSRSSTRVRSFLLRAYR